MLLTFGSLKQTSVEDVMIVKVNFDSLSIFSGLRQKVKTSGSRAW